MLRRSLFRMLLGGSLMTFGKGNSVGFQNPGEILTKLVVIFGTGETGWFEYNGTPALGNPPIAYAAPPGVTTDPYGNTLPTTNGGVTSARYTGSAAQQVSELSAGTVNLYGGAASQYTQAGGLTVPNGTAEIGLQSPATTADANPAHITLYSGGVTSIEVLNADQVVVSPNSVSAGITDAEFEVQGTSAFEDPISAIVGGALETWHAIPLAAGWSTLAGHPVPSYRLLPDGNVQICGYASHANFAATTALSTALPAAYQPLSEIFLSDAGPDTAGIEVTTGGIINAVPLAAGSVQVNFSGIYPVNL
jgi:hypothetical protein